VLLVRVALADAQRSVLLVMHPIKKIVSFTGKGSFADCA